MAQVCFLSLGSSWSLPPESPTQGTVGKDRSGAPGRPHPVTGKKQRRKLFQKVPLSRGFR